MELFKWRKTNILSSTEEEQISSSSGIQVRAIRIKITQAILTDTESQDRSMFMETWAPRTQRDVQAMASLLLSGEFPPYVTVKHLPQRTHRMYQPFNAFCRVSKQLTRCWCPPEFITTRFSYARKKKNVLVMRHSVRGNCHNFCSVKWGLFR